MSNLIDKLRQMASPAADGGPVEAVWNGTVIARSDRTVVVEGNHYFPQADALGAHLEASPNHTVCPWKGTASYYDVVVDGKRNEAAAWYYPDPKPAARQIRDHVAFWRGVKVRQATSTTD